MERLCGLLFELSNKHRLGAMLALRDKPMSVTRLAEHLQILTQECSRHAARLAELDLIIKRTDGSYHATSFGDLVLEQLADIEFIAEHSNYFVTHSMKGVPENLLSRIGELRGSIFVDNPLLSIHSIEEMVSRTEEYFWTINFPVPASIFPLLRQAFKRGVQVRFIAPRHYEVHPIMRGAGTKEDREAYLNALRSSQIQQAYIDRMDATIWVSEKELALLSFPKPDGTFDMTGFKSTENKPTQWCKELFESYWSCSSTTRQRGA